MSATGRGGIRLEADAYETPGWVFDQFLPYLKVISPNPQGILEPGAGTGNLVNKLRMFAPKAQIVAVEKRQECQKFLEEAGANQVSICDYLTWNPWHPPDCKGFDLIFGNPPFGGSKYKKGGGENPDYGLWLRFVQKSIDLLTADGILIFLLRIAVLESQDRNEWMRMHVPDVYVLPKRPSFTGGGNDSAAYAWMAWRKEPCEAGKIRVLPNP